MSDWRDFEEGRRGVSLAQLSDGEVIEVFVDDNPYLNTEEIEQSDGSTETSEALRVPAVIVDAPDDFADMSGDPIEVVDVDEIDEDTMRYHIINSSTAFKTAMREEFPDGVSPVASVVTIEANQPGDAFTRSYLVSQFD